MGLLQNGVLVARASGSFARTGHQPYDVAPKTDTTIPPAPILPKSEQWKDAPFLIWASGTDRTPKNPSVDRAGWTKPGRRYAWIYQNLALIEGFELTSFVRAAMAGDVTSSLTHTGLRISGSSTPITASPSVDRHKVISSVLPPPVIIATPVSDR